MAGGHTSARFDIHEDNYEEFIQSLREILKYDVSHGVNILMPQTEPLSWLDIHLVSGDSTIILRIDKRNLYVRGYSRDGGQTFWEFSDSWLISGSRPLAYGGSYVDGYNFVDAAGQDVTRETLQLGVNNLSNAIASLARTEDPNSTENNGLQNCARSLLVLTQMIAESTRFSLITNHIVRNWFDSAPLTPELVRLQQIFASLSSGVQRADFPIYTEHTPLPNVPSWTVGQASRALGIMLYFSVTSRRRKREAEGTNVSNVRTLVSIEYIRVNNIDGHDVGKLYGTVTVEDFWGLHTVYDRSSSHYERKGPGELATLTGPSTAISGDDVFIINVNLWDHDTFSPDDKIAQGNIVWEPRNENITFAKYDKRLENYVNGKYGNVTVGYSVVREALNATVKVLMINGDKESPAQVYGTIKASQVIEGTSTILLLFKKSSDDYINVNPNDSIPLTRSVVVAPISYGLKITVDLWDYDIISFNDQIAQGSADFDAVVGTQTKSIYGKAGEVQVSVTCE